MDRFGYTCLAGITASMLSIGMCRQPGLDLFLEQAQGSEADRGSLSSSFWSQDDQ